MNPSDLKKPENKNDSRGRKNLALQLNQVMNEIDRSGVKQLDSAKQSEPLLEQAPESERSNALSIPVSASDGDFSARQGFNQVQNFAMSGKGMAVDDMMLSGSDKKSVGQELDNLDINLDSQNNCGIERDPSNDLLISDIRADNQESSKRGDCMDNDI